MNPNSSAAESLPAQRDSVEGTPGRVIDFARRKRALDLATLTDVRREMARVYRDVRKGDLPPDKGAKMTFMLSSIAKVSELAELQPRMEALERIMKRRIP